MKSLHHTNLGALLAMTAATASLMSMQAVAAEQLMDPTRPATAKAVPVVAPGAQPIKVEAIMSSAGHPLAIVNGKVVRAGDSIGAVRIEEILGDGVRFNRDGRSQVARVGKQMIPVRRNVSAGGDQS
jgi:hypothetical protein